MLIIYIGHYVNVKLTLQTKGRIINLYLRNIFCAFGVRWGKICCPKIIGFTLLQNNRLLENVKHKHLEFIDI